MKQKYFDTKSRDENTLQLLLSETVDLEDKVPKLPTASIDCEPITKKHNNTQDSYSTLRSLLTFLIPI